MARHLFPNFATDAGEHEAAGRYWMELISEIAESVGQLGEWQPWQPRYTFDEPGNPICDGWSVKLDRAFRIIQHAPVDDHVAIAAWMSHFDDGFGHSEFPRDELIISLVLSEESAGRARDLLRMWMRPETTPDAMRAAILRLDASVPRPLPLRADASGVLRVGHSRVPLQTIVAQQRRETPAEAIAHQYSMIGLAEVYALLGYCLEHPKEIDAYVREQDAVDAQSHSLIDAQYPSADIRDYLRMCADSAAPEAFRGRLMLDETVSQAVQRAVYRAAPGLEVIEPGLAADGHDDAALLAHAAELGAALLTFDLHTMLNATHERITRGDAVPGVFAVRAQGDAGTVAAQVASLMRTDAPDVVNRVVILPQVALC